MHEPGILIALFLLASQAMVQQPHAAMTAGLPVSPDAAARFDFCTQRQAAGDIEREAVTQYLSGRPGSTQASVRATTALIDAGFAIAAASASQKKCVSAFRKGERRFNKRLAGRLRQRSAPPQQEGEALNAIDAIRSELHRLWIKDQVARTTYLDLQTDETDGAAFWAYRLAAAHAIMVDEESGVFIKNALDEFDWIDIQRFGESASHRAWLLVQHADSDVDFQERVLARMQPYLQTGGVSKSNYAYLWDRVAVNRGKLQRYGTQSTSECVDGLLQPAPMEAPDSIDERRAEMGLGPIAGYFREMSSYRCR